MKCPKCGEEENIHANIDWTKSNLPIENYYCNVCDTEFPPETSPRNIKKEGLKMNLKEEIEKHKIKCHLCNGDGYTAEHDPFDPHEGGECSNCPIQVQCENCHATGYILPISVAEEIAEAYAKEKAWESWQYLNKMFFKYELTEDALLGMFEQYKEENK